MSKSKGVIVTFVGLCLALMLAGCQAGGSATGSNGASWTPAPIQVPQGYTGIVRVTFSSATTYDQAISLLESAGMKAQVQCPNPGPVRADPTPVSNADSQKA